MSLFVLQYPMVPTKQIHYELSIARSLCSYDHAGNTEKKTYIDLKSHVKRGNRILFVDYAVRQWLQTVRERKKLYLEFVCGDVSYRKTHAICRIFVAV